MERQTRTSDKAAERASKNKEWKSKGFRKTRTLGKGGTARLGRERAKFRKLTQQLVAQIRRHRKKLGISQAEIARRMGTPASVVARLETEPHNCTMHTLLRYVEAAEGTLTIEPRPQRKRRAS